MSDPRSDPFITPTQFRAAVTVDKATDLGNLRQVVTDTLAKMEAARTTNAEIITVLYLDANVTSVVSELTQAGWSVATGVGKLSISLPASS